jgi:putative DNA methylase
LERGNRAHLVCLNVFAFDARKLDSLRYPDNEIMTTKKKLIEVALPLEAINKAAAREKSIRHGHPSTLHLWWARRPLAAARAVIFAQMVDDPSGYVDTLKSDPKLLRKAESILKARRKVWELARETFEKAEAAGIAAQHPGPEPALDAIIAEQERNRLFKIIEDLVLWENTTNEVVLEKARAEIWQSWRRACAENADHPRAQELFDRHKLPAFHDPFAGGGALPLEAQRLGLESYASDLNPVAVLINKAMIEIPPRFVGKPPVNPAAQNDKQLFAKGWKGAQGLAEDVRYYGKWMRDEAEKRIGHLYPKVAAVQEADGSYRHATAEEIRNPNSAIRNLTVIAWLWARTVKSPNPAFADVDVPLASTFMLSTKSGKEAYVEPVIENRNQELGNSSDGSPISYPLSSTSSPGYRFTVKTGKPPDAEAAKSGTKMARGSFRCLMSGVPIRYEYIDDEANAGRMGERLMAIVAEGERGRVYLPPTERMVAIARSAVPTWKSDAPSRGTWASNAQGRRYGFRTFGDYFTPRQLVALTTFSDLVGEAMERIRHDALAAGLPDDGKPLRDGGKGAMAYAEAVGVYLAFALSKVANIGSSIASWMSDRGAFRETFARQAIPMVWDYAESNPFADAGGSLGTALDKGAMVIDSFPASTAASACQFDAATQTITSGKLVSTDPPYYDNIGYADLSDFFYVWLRRSLRPVFPNLFATLAVPKAEELVATPYRHGSKDKAEKFFLDGMTQAMHRLAEQSHPAFPVTVYYAFKQSESESDAGTASTGWETFLDAVIRAGFAISGTWPMRTEGAGRMIAKDTNALASSIILVCRKRAADASTATRREFVAALKRELPDALRLLQAGNIAPVDLAQAAIGPGMGVFTRYARVLDAEGKPMTVREALALINQTLDEALAEQEGDFDADSRWALAWFEQNGFAEGEYGVAETLSKAKNTSVKGMEDAGIVVSTRGKVRLLKPEELPAAWNPATDTRLTAWEVVHHLVRVLAIGESAAAALVAQLGARAEVARELAYRLYTLCERKKRAAEALAYNSLVQSWPEIVRLAQEEKAVVQEQGELFGEE